ncbi:hypothetical protein CYMTET_46237 [Cymbomonas tetramitiformis]|uniref:Uncharacterized protein n=1 Tax=Cymbomonas tetramitiformis TaxID=36881 RepID=A0AAE0BWM1_9CHLO|nr:hypothetical protein CYMTET_46237 [Cymbomonas tetramitiformis]
MLGFYDLLASSTAEALQIAGATSLAVNFQFDCQSWRRVASCRGYDFPSCTSASEVATYYCKTVGLRVDLVVSLVGVNNLKQPLGEDATYTAATAEDVATLRQAVQGDCGSAWLVLAPLPPEPEYYGTPDAGRYHYFLELLSQEAAKYPEQMTWLETDRTVYPSERIDAFHYKGPVTKQRIAHLTAHFIATLLHPRAVSAIVRVPSASDSESHPPLPPPSPPPPPPIPPPPPPPPPPPRPEQVGRSALPVLRGGAALLLRRQLHFLDDDTPPTHLIFQLTTPPAYGSLFQVGVQPSTLPSALSPRCVTFDAPLCSEPKNGQILDVGDHFSQAEVIGGFIMYRQDAGSVNVSASSNQTCLQGAMWEGPTNQTWLEGATSEDSMNQTWLQGATWEGPTNQTWLQGATWEGPTNHTQLQGATWEDCIELQLSDGTHLLQRIQQRVVITSESYEEAVTDAAQAPADAQGYPGAMVPTEFTPTPEGQALPEAAPLSAPAPVIGICKCC